MGDIRHELNARRDLLRADEGFHRQELAADPGSPRYGRAERALAELRQIEDTLATFQLADAQRDLVRAQKAATKAQQAATDEQRKANDAADNRKSVGEEVQFWSRRFFTNVAIANAAGFVAVLTFMLKEDSPTVPVADTVKALANFGAGALLGGSAPIFRLMDLGIKGAISEIRAIDAEHPVHYSPYQRFVMVAGHWMTRFMFINWLGISVALACFLAGLAIVIGCARGYYGAKGSEKPKEPNVIVRVVQTPPVAPSVAIDAHRKAVP